MVLETLLTKLMVMENKVNAYYKIESLEESFDNKYQQTYQNLQLKNDSGDDITKLSTA